MTHTPGPWHWDSDPIKGDPLNRVRYRVTALGRTITQCYYPRDESGQAEADARLIAAAPAMADEIVALKAKLIRCEEALRAFDLRDESLYWAEKEPAGTCAEWSEAVRRLGEARILLEWWLRWDGEDQRVTCPLDPTKKWLAASVR